jgi:hypothetical protein
MRLPRRPFSSKRTPIAAAITTMANTGSPRVVKVLLQLATLTRSLSFLVFWTRMPLTSLHDSISRLILQTTKQGGFPTETSRLGSHPCPARPFTHIIGSLAIFASSWGQTLVGSLSSLPQQKWALTNSLTTGSFRCLLRGGPPRRRLLPCSPEWRNVG